MGDVLALDDLNRIYRLYFLPDVVSAPFYIIFMVAKFVNLAPKRNEINYSQQRVTNGNLNCRFPLNSCKIYL